MYFLGIPLGALTVDDPQLREIEDALQIAERSGDDMALAFTRSRWVSHCCTAATTRMLPRAADPRRRRGVSRRGHNLSELRLVNAYLAREKGSARRSRRR